MSTTNYPYARLSDTGFDTYVHNLSVRFIAEASSGPLFTTDVDPDAVWAKYLDSIPDPVERQHYNCSACRHFLKRYASLAQVTAEGKLHSPVWDVDQAPYFFHEFAAWMYRAVSRAEITGAFVSGSAVLGTPETGEWKHFALTLPPSAVFKKNPLKTPGQRAAELAHNVETVRNALLTYPTSLLAEALNIVKSEALDRTEKILGGAQWLYDASVEFHSSKGQRARQNLLWKRVVAAPDGFCHPKASMIGTLLEDLEAGKGFEACKRSFNTKMHPLNYQRPKAAPREGVIDRAEKIFEALNLGSALRRRFARVEEVEALWRPTQSPSRGSDAGLFGQLRGAREDAREGVIADAGQVSWAKFSEKVLPEALDIEFKVPAHGSFCALVNAVDPGAEPLFRWNHPVSWYLYANGSSASRWLLRAGDWVKVTAICANPAHWNGREDPNNPQSALFLLQGAKDSGQPSLCIFPETLRAELREVASVIEAHSRRGQMEGAEQASACGHLLSSSSPTLLRVRNRLGTTQFRVSGIE